MKIIIRRMFECGSSPRWRPFERILSEELKRLGHQVKELDLDPTFPADPEDTEFRIYAHKTKRDIQGIDLFFKEMHMQGLFTIDTDGWGADHSAMQSEPVIDVDTQAAKRFCQELRARFLTTGLSKHGQPEIRSLPERIRPFIFVPLQSIADDVIMFHSPISVEDYVNMMAEWAERTHKKIVFKGHPAKQPSIEALIEKLASNSSYVYSLDENVHGLIDAAIGVFVLNSGVGFESLIHGKPVVTFGNSDYRWVTYQASPDTIDQALGYAHNYTEEQRLAGYRFVYHYHHHHGYNLGREGRLSEPGLLRLRAYLNKVLNG